MEIIFLRCATMSEERDCPNNLLQSERLLVTRTGLGYVEKFANIKKDSLIKLKAVFAKDEYSFVSFDGGSKLYRCVPRRLLI